MADENGLIPVTSDMITPRLSNSEKTKRALFEKYKTNLNLLIDSDILVGEKDEYVCPICLRDHKSLTETDPLSPEHAPPDKLGGKPVILTCTSCNGFAGVTIDNQFVEALKQLQMRSFLPNTSAPIDIEYEGKTVRSVMKVDEEKNITVETHKKNNRESDKKEFEDKAKEGLDAVFSFKRKDLNIHRIDVALLKTALMLFVEKTGFAYIYDDCFDVIRRQIQNPDLNLIPSKFFFTPPADKMPEGVFFIKNKGIESILVSFDVEYKNYKQRHAVLLPLGKNTLFKISKNLEARFKKEGGGFHIEFDPINDDFLTDVSKIEKYGEWIDNIKL